MILKLSNILIIIQKYNIIEKHLISTTNKNNIINGRKIETNESWIAEIIIKFKGRWQHLCGGALIHPKWVLTAAHSFFQHNNPKQLYAPYDVYRVCIGSLKQFEGYQFSITNIKNADFDMTTDKKVVFNDIALLELNKSVPSSVATPITMATNKMENYYGKIGYIFGWGVTSTPASIQHRLNRYSGELLIGNVFISDNKTSKDILSRVDLNKICVDYQLSNSIACEGDSGGPLTIRDRNGNHLLIGVSSYGDTDCQDWDVYTRVTSYLRWIQVVTGHKIKSTFF